MASNQVKVLNSTDMQLPVPVVDTYGNKNTVLMQPRGRVDLPEGLSVIQPYPQGITVQTPPAQAVAAKASDTKNPKEA